jgi:hypothetical protein
VIAHGIVDDLHEESSWVRDFVQTVECLQCMKGYVLFQVFIVERCARPFCRQVNERADVRWIKNHVTVFLAARLYKA